MEIIGIYKIGNIVDNKFYIGSSKNIKHRRAAHWSGLRTKTHPNRFLQRAYDQYGKLNFIFEILEECSLNILIEREQFYIDTLKPEYNLRLIAHNNSGFHHEIETKNKISKTSINMWKKDGMKEQILSKRRKEILCYDLDGNFIKEFKSVKEAAEELDIFSTNISKILMGKSNIIHGFTFRYKTENYALKINMNDYKQKKINNILKTVEKSKIKLEIFINDISIGVFSSKKEATKKLRMSYEEINKIIKGNNTTCRIKKYRNWKITIL